MKQIGEYIKMLLAMHFPTIENINLNLIRENNKLVIKFEGEGCFGEMWLIRDAGYSPVLYGLLEDDLTYYFPPKLENSVEIMRNDLKKMGVSLEYFDEEHYS